MICRWVQPILGGDSGSVLEGNAQLLMHLLIQGIPPHPVGSPNRPSQAFLDQSGLNNYGVVGTGGIIRKDISHPYRKVL